MIIKIILLLLSLGKQKELAIAILDNIIQSKSSDINNNEAVKIIEMVVKSSGNKVSSFIVRD
jgi:hypothetical protein